MTWLRWFNPVQRQGTGLDVLNAIRRLTEAKRVEVLDRGGKAQQRHRFSNATANSESGVTAAAFQNVFTTADVYAFTRELEQLHPDKHGAIAPSEFLATIRHPPSSFQKPPLFSVDFNHEIHRAFAIGLQPVCRRPTRGPLEQRSQYHRRRAKNRNHKTILISGLNRHKHTTKTYTKGER
jgi:hypothetical protein